MRIGVNLLYLRPGEVGGSETYVREIVPRIAALCSGVEVYTSQSAIGSLPPWQGTRHVTVIGSFSQARRLIGENWHLRRHVRHLDVLFSPANFAVPLLPSVTQVATIHDLQHRALPNYFSTGRRWARDVFFRATLHRCDKVIAISEFTRQEVLTEYGTTPERVVAVAQGINVAERPNEAVQEAVRRRYDLPGTFLYYPATLAPHKNHRFLIAVLSMVRRAVGIPVQLILTGNRDHAWPELERHIHASGMSDHVRHLGFLPRTDILPLLSCSAALVFPSRFEGFGLPLLEAMACGVPIISSDAAALREVAGDAAVLVSPQDCASWVQAVAKVLTDREFATELVARGTRHVEGFSWDTCALKTLKVLEDAVRVARDRRSPPRG